jgi:hypothetical protein
MEDVNTMKINNLCVAITFHYNPNRLKYLEQVTSHIDDLANKVKLFIITNEHEENYLREIEKSTKAKNFQIVTSGPLLHRYYLTWQHLKIFRTEYRNDLNISHFMYLEDDIQIKQNNISYWLKAREDLRQYGLIPSFLLYEVSKINKRSNSLSKPMIFRNIPKIKIGEFYWYLNMSQPYQAMYLLDRELAKEHLFDNPLEKRETIWGVRETAAAGLTFVNIPNGFSSRVAVGFDYNSFIIDSNSLIHHLPNNYVNRPLTEYGKIKIQDLVLTNKNLFYFVTEIKIVLLRAIWKIRKTRVKYKYLIKNLMKQKI